MNDKNCFQKDVFKCSEGDYYYHRNRNKLEEALKSSENDPVLRSISHLGLQPQSILEIGCSNGWRLHVLGRQSHAQCFGIDPSEQAVREGMEIFKGLSLQQATADEIPYPDQKFDLVIIGFCLYLCDRKDLFKIASEVDRVLMNRGKLIILDFYPPFPYRNTYTHCPGMFSFKMNYGNLFLWNPAYVMIYQDVFTDPPENIHIADERMSVIVMNKDTDGAYPDSPFQKT